MRKLTVVIALASLLLSGVAEAKNVPQCSHAVASDFVEAARDFSYCLKTNPPAPGAVNPCAGFNLQEYHNRPAKLPKARHNETYQEGRVGAARDGRAGVRRLVFLVQGNVPGRDSRILERYLTDDHYDSFCKFH